MSNIRDFVLRRNRRSNADFPALSLFSGAGLSDIGYELAGFRFIVHCELDENRAAIGKRNFPDSEWVVGDIREKRDEIIEVFQKKARGVRPYLCSLTPPCQGLSSSNPGRGKISNPKQSDQRNTLLLEALPIIRALRPRLVVAENVAPLLARRVKWRGKTKTVVQAFARGLSEYQLYVGVVEMADYGVPQMRRRSILVAIHKDEGILLRLKAKGLLPWPRPTHAAQPQLGRAKWMTVREWLELMKYPPLNARTKPSDENFPLHFVPKYPEGDHRYTMVRDIPANSGQNAYTNDRCPTCRKNSIPEYVARCPHCDEPLYNRPIVKAKNGKWRLIKGFNSSYRRASPAQPAPTVTTNSSHLGSDTKIHPWENRVLSVLECADLQTIPRFYNWGWALETGHRYVMRNVIGEALPPYFTYLHGQLLVRMLQEELPVTKLSRAKMDGQKRKFVTVDSKGR